MEEVSHIYIPVYIMARKDLSLTEKVLMGKIIALTKKEGYCYASNEYLAIGLNLSKQRISHYLSKFVAMGILTREVVRNEKAEVTVRKLFPNFKVEIPPLENDNTPPLENDKENIELLNKDIQTKIKTLPSSTLTLLETFLTYFNGKFNKSYRETPERRKLLLKRLKAFTFEQILKAVDNLAADKFNHGKNDRHWEADPDYLLRNDGQVDKFLNKSPIVEESNLDEKWRLSG